MKTGLSPVEGVQSQGGGELVTSDGDKSSATIRDVARLAGVGVGTVSRVLNNHPSVRPETRKRVLEAVRTLNYRPNPSARRLSLRKTLTIGVIVPFITNPSVTERLRGIIMGVESTEYDLVIYNVETPQHRDRYFREVPRRERVDGLIIISLMPHDEDVRTFQASGVPVILVDTVHSALPSVAVDDVAGGRMATEYLMRLGHRRIAFLGDVYPNPFRFTSSYYRYLGYAHALAEVGIPLRDEYVVTGEHSRQVAYALAQRLLHLPEPPTALFAASDTQALGVLAAAKAMGVRIPEDLSLVGYDDLEVSEYLGLTTIHQPLYESGWEAARLLLTRLQGGEVPQKHVLPLRLEERETTRPLLQN